MSPLKDEICAALVRELGAELVRAWPAFPLARFTARAARGLEPLELQERVDLVADRLAATLPGRFPRAADVLWSALESPTFDGWMVWPCGVHVARAGIDQPDLALDLLGDLTSRWSSEFAIRPFIEAHHDLTYTRLDRWARDPDEHKRRLASEATRPRLPWAPRIAALVADPSPNLPLLEALVEDDSPYVRRSVANHLNDISKDHPDLAVELAQRWRSRPGGNPAWIVRHGLRTLVKQGHPLALAAIGVDADAPIEVTGFSLGATSASVGDEVPFALTLVLVGGGPADAVIDYRVHYIGANGRPRPPKVFKLARRYLEPHVPVTVTGRHRFADVSIRRHHPGPHQIDVQVNGRVSATAVVDITPDE